jgi:hypothetical protein
VSRLDEIRGRLAALDKADAEMPEGQRYTLARVRAMTDIIKNAYADLAYLLGEVERLQGEAERERAAIVAWLRHRASCLTIPRDEVNACADAIERGCPLSSDGGSNAR